MEDRIKRETIFMSSRSIRLVVAILLPIIVVFFEYLIISEDIQWYWIVLWETILIFFVWMSLIFALTRIEFYDKFFKVFYIGSRKVQIEDVKEISCTFGLNSGVNDAYDLWFTMKNEEDSFRVQYFQFRSGVLFFKRRLVLKPIENVLEKVRSIVLTNKQ